MKKLLLLLCLFTISTQLLQAQKLDSATAASQQRWHNYYWQNYKKKVTTARILLGTGLVAMAGGLYLLGENFSEYPSIDVPVGVTAIVGAYGLEATLTSIPFFVAAGNSKRKARLALKGERVSFGNGALSNSGYTAFQ